MMEKLAMGQYADYVWSSYGLALIVLVLCIVQARRRHRRVLRDITRRLRLMESNE